MPIDARQFVAPRTIGSLAIPHDRVKPWNQGSPIKNPIHFAAVGDVHGSLTRLDEGLRRWNSVHPTRPLDFALQVGDLEAIRDDRDLASVIGPEKYRTRGTFSEYHSGARKFPVTTHAIGGNHEAHTHFEEHPNGGHLADNIYYEGRTFVRNINGLRVAGLSGIFNEDVYNNGRPSAHPEVPGKRAKNWRPWTYFTKEEIESAKKLFAGAEVLMLHEWPAHLFDILDPHTTRGDTNDFLAACGSEPALDLLATVKPDLLICGHMHSFLSGQIFWRSGEVTEVLCLDTLSPDSPVNRRNTAIIEAGPDGMRITKNHAPKIQTPELAALYPFINDENKSFSFSLGLNIDAELIKQRIKALMPGISWEDDFFVMQGMKFELVENTNPDTTKASDEFDGYIFAPHSLRVSPLLSPHHMSAARVINTARTLLEGLRAANLEPTLLAEFNGHI